jgi:3-deoxy-7-phosphoheptulonate synthase
MLELFKNKPVIIAGPCAIESEEQILRISSELGSLGIKYLRGGAYKPRTSPRTFQGLGRIGLEYMRKAADVNNMLVVSELLETKQLEESYDLVDVIQIGSRNMASYGFLKEVGKLTAKDNKPVLLKRGFNATLNELIFASEYIIEYGNPNVIFCLRGIRTFEQIDSKMRYTPDLASIVELKEMTAQPIIFDPSHSTGNSKYVIEISKAALLLGADGLMIETHFRPEEALSDAEQAIHPEKLKEIMDFISKID